MKQNKNMDTTVRPTVKKISEVMQNACKVQRICRVHAQQNMLTPTYRLGGGHVFCMRTGLDELSEDFCELCVAAKKKNMLYFPPRG